MVGVIRIHSIQVTSIKFWSKTDRPSCLSVAIEIATSNRQYKGGWHFGRRRGRKCQFEKSQTYRGFIKINRTLCVWVDDYEAAVEAAPVEYASVSLPEGTARRLKSMIRSACRL